MSSDASSIVQKLWNYCDVLQDDGVSYGDYTQQLTNILFLKMADELTKPPFSQEPIIPKGYNWQTLLLRRGDDQETH